MRQDGGLDGLPTFFILNHFLVTKKVCIFVQQKLQRVVSDRLGYYRQTFDNQSLIEHTPFNLNVSTKKSIRRLTNWLSVTYDCVFVVK